MGLRINNNLHVNESGSLVINRPAASPLRSPPGRVVFDGNEVCMLKSSGDTSIVIDCTGDISFQHNVCETQGSAVTHINTSLKAFSIRAIGCRFLDSFASTSIGVSLRSSAHAMNHTVNNQADYCIVADTTLTNKLTTSNFSLNCRPEIALGMLDVSRTTGQDRQSILAATGSTILAQANQTASTLLKLLG